MKIPATIPWREAVIRQAASYRFIREYAGPNDGEGVRFCQAATGNAPPDYWCMSFVVRAVLEALSLACPLILSASCEEQRARAERKGALRTREEFNNLAKINPEKCLAMVALQVKMLPDSTGALTIPHAHHAMLVGGILRIHTPTEHLIGALSDGSFYTTEGNASDPKLPGSRNGTGAYTGRKRGTVDDELLYVFIDLEAL